MNHAAHLAALELFRDVTCASCMPTRKHAGWKRDQYMRRTGPEPLAFAGDAPDARDFAPARLSAAKGFST